MDLNQVTLPCVDYEQSVAFYRRLGLRQIVDSPPRYARFECPSGATFSLHAVTGDRVDSGVVVYFEVEDLDRVHADLAAAGVVFSSPPTRQPWLWYEARLRDPAGNEICLYHAGENRRYPPWRMS